MPRFTIPGLDAELKQLEAVIGALQQKIESLEKRVEALEGAAAQEDKKAKKDKGGQ